MSIHTTDYSAAPGLAPVEAQVLAQYQLLANQLRTLNDEMAKLNTRRADDANAEVLLENLRNLEMKIGLVYTLFKGAVYLLFLQNEEDENLKGEEDEAEEEEA